MPRDAWAVGTGEQRGAARGGTAGLRLAELVAALSLATNLGMGQPMEQALRTCLLALRERLGLGPPQLSDVYYVALLRFLGCTADAHETAAIVGGDELAFVQACGRRSTRPVATCTGTTTESCLAICRCRPPSFRPRTSTASAYPASSSGGAAAIPR